MLEHMGRRKPGRIFSGVGGWNFAPWRGTFYPEALAQRLELSHASRRLTSIEINSTFYGPQKPSTFQRWHDETPAGFMFAVKAPRFVTNRRRLAEGRAGIDRFLEGGVTRLARKLGPINWQLAPTKRFDAADIEAFLELLPDRIDGLPLRHALEVRHESFATPALVASARRRHVAIVLAADSPYPQIADATADFAYLRIMGTVTKHAAGYSPAALTAWARRAKALAAGEAISGFETVDKGPKPQPRDVFLYFISGAKVRNPLAAEGLIERLARPVNRRR